MNIFGAIGIAGVAGAAIGSAIEKRRGERLEEQLAKRPNNKHIYIHMDVSDGEVEFKVTELDNSVLYRASGKLSKMRVSFKVRTSHGKAVGKVQKSLIAMRNPLLHEDNPADFNITLEDSNKIEVKTARGLSDFVIEPYGWKSRYVSGEYVVSNEAEELFYYDTWGYYKYIVDYRYDSIERQAVLITMAIMAKDYWDSLQDK